MIKLAVFPKSAKRLGLAHCEQTKLFLKIIPLSTEKLGYRVVIVEQYRTLRLIKMLGLCTRSKEIWRPLRIEGASASSG